MKKNRNQSTDAARLRRRAEETLSASEARYRRLFETARDGILILDAETGMVVDVNSFLIKMLGYSHEAFLGKKVWELGFFKDIVANQDNFAELQQKGYIRYGDMPLETSDGRRVEVEFVSSLYLVNHQKVIQCNIRDITGRKQAEEKIRRLATVVRDSSDAITIQDFDGRITAWNRGAELMYGYSEAEALLANIERLTAPGKVEEQKEFTRRLMAGEAITAFETQRLTKDGRVLEVWLTVTKLMDDAGKPVGIASTERDITERNQVAEKMRRMATVVRDSNDAITIQDFAGRITAWNRGAELMYGYSEAEALLQNIERLTAPGKVDEQRDFTRRLVAGEAITAFETQRVAKDGRVLDVWLTVTKLMDAAGNPSGIASTERDITERKRAEEEVQRLNADLEQRVVERTAQLGEANKELESFSYTVSHDLHAPLLHVQGYVNMLAREVGGQLSERGRRYMKTIEDASRKMGVLIDDLLAFSRMGRADMSETMVNLDSLVQDTLGDLEPVTRERNIVWTIPPLPAVQADPAMLKLALTNLLGNAVKFTRLRNPAEIEIGCDGMEGDRVIVFVRDNGVGFDPQYAHKLFGVFQRLHRADEFEGTGIGLANVRRTIARQGGRVWAEGGVDRGATFYFTLKPSSTTGPVN